MLWWKQAFLGVRVVVSLAGAVAMVAGSYDLYQRYFGSDATRVWDPMFGVVIGGGLLVMLVSWPGEETRSQARRQMEGEPPPVWLIPLLVAALMWALIGGTAVSVREADVRSRLEVTQKMVVGQLIDTVALHSLAQYVCSELLSNTTTECANGLTEAARSAARQQLGP